MNHFIKKLQEKSDINVGHSCVSTYTLIWYLNNYKEISQRNTL